MYLTENFENKDALGTACSHDAFIFGKISTVRIPGARVPVTRGLFVLAFVERYVHRPHPRLPMLLLSFSPLDEISASGYFREKIIIFLRIRPAHPAPSAHILHVCVANIESGMISKNFENQE